MSKNITRRKFFSHAAATASGLALGSDLIGFSGTGKTLDEATDLMDEVLKYRKIDSHAHVYFSPDSPEIQIDFADRLGIEKLVISRPMSPGSKGLPEEFVRCNNLILDAVSKFPDRFIGQATLNPTYLQESMDEIDRCMDHGMVGLKLYNHVKLSDPLFYPIIEKFIDLKMIILMHMGIGRSRVVLDAREPENVSTPEDFVIAAERFPEAMFQLAHLGGGGDWLDACKAVKPYSNVYVDLSGSNNEADIISFALEQLGEDRLLFGCDNSFYQGVGHVLAAELNENQRKKIFFDNYNSILKKSGKNVD
ncbi:amidohydrolase family protein [Cyclobacterium xiamenense]|jgi:predicted TIM-barrel fold metal-dependent hydrolase|uniref:amidohydrolase family protein n=1 Tax=Cyclobacterium xiamenense TaxID=1297121 RepID=UPI0035CF8E75